MGLFIDVLILGGVISVTYGAYLLGIEYGFMVGGAFAFFIGVSLAIAKAQAQAK